MMIFAKGWNINKDGPGQRLIFYLKGCNMKCAWCANPEGISRKKQLLFYPDRIKNSPVHICPYNAVHNKQLDRAKCRTCNTHDCIVKWKCPCFELSGENILPQEILALALNAKAFFSGNGGVTFSGGEPTLQAEELKAALKLLKNNKINTCVETNASSIEFKGIAAITDYLICDFKVFDHEIHNKYTGISNERIIENLFYAATNHRSLLIRIPCVSGVNTDRRQMNEMVRFLAEMNQKRQRTLKQNLHVEILRLHHIGEPKYRALDMTYEMSAVKPPDLKTISGFKRKLADCAIEISTSA